MAVKVSVPDYSGAFAGGFGSPSSGGSSSSWQSNWGGGGIDWSKSIPKFDGSGYGQKAFGDSSIDWSNIVNQSYGSGRDELFEKLFGKAKETDKWQKAAMKSASGGPTSDFSIMPGIGAQSGKLGDNLSFVQPASPSSMVIPGQQSPFASLGLGLAGSLLSPVLGVAGGAIAKGIFG